MTRYLFEKCVVSWLSAIDKTIRETFILFVSIDYLHI